MQFKTHGKVLRRSPLNPNNIFPKLDYDTSSTWIISWPATILWIVLSVTIPVASCFIHVHKEWTVHVNDDDTSFWLRYNRSAIVSSVGLSYAYMEDGKCMDFAPDEDIQFLPLWAWEAARILHAVGCALFCWSAAFAILGYVWFYNSSDQKFLSTSVGNIQLLAVILHTISLLLYPMMFGSSIAKTLCGKQATAFAPGNCRMGWAYISAIVITAVSWYCPALSRLTHHQQYMPRFKYYDIIVSVKAC